MNPERKRRTLEEVRRRLGPEKVSERRACKVLGQPRGTQRYAKRRPADEAKLLEEMRRIARKRSRFGSPRIHQTLRKGGWKVVTVHTPCKRKIGDAPSGGFSPVSTSSRSKLVLP